VTPPLRAQYEQAFAELRDALTTMGQQVERAIRGSVRALEEHDVRRAEQVLRDEDLVNRMHHDIDDSCVRLLATEQPVATDLRQIVGTLNVIAQLERTGDLAVHMARVAQRLASEQLIKELIAIPLMADETCSMLRDSVRSFVTQDSALAEQVSARDNKVDETYSHLFRELLTYMMETPRNITQASSLLFVAKQLERAGDHATNICEAAIYVTTGKHVDLNR